MRASGFEIPSWEVDPATGTGFGLPDPVKLIKQALFHYQDEKSDKVYLCEVAADQHVVNVRYGRHGSNLRDGTKTAMPVKRARAEKVFDKLVASKVNKGYRDTSTKTTAATSSNAAAASSGGGDRGGDIAESVLWYLKNPDDEWPLDRVIWPAGELRITEAEPVVLTAERCSPRFG